MTPRVHLLLTLAASLALLCAAPVRAQEAPPSTQPNTQLRPATRPDGAPSTRRRLIPVTPTNPEQTKKAPTLLRTLTPVSAPAHHSVGVVFCDDKEVVLATVVRPDGYLVTKATELSSLNITVKLSSGVTLPAKLVGTAVAHDLALLKVDAANLTPVEWADPSSLKVGEIVLAPGEGPQPLAMGVVSVGRRSSTGGFLGVQFARTSEESDEPRIEAVTPGMPAFKAGLKAGDIITHVNDQAYDNTTDLREFLQRQNAGTEISITVKRAGETMVFRATLTVRPSEFNPSSDRARSQNTMGGNILSNRSSDFPAIIQTDLVLLPIQQGGPVINLDGQAIGVNIARAGRVETFALPSEVVQALIPDLMAGRYAPTTRPSELASVVADPGALEDDTLGKRIDALKAKIKEMGTTSSPSTRPSDIDRTPEDLEAELKMLTEEQTRRDAARPKPYVTTRPLKDIEAELRAKAKKAREDAEKPKP